MHSHVASRSRGRSPARLISQATLLVALSLLWAPPGAAQSLTVTVGATTEYVSTSSTSPDGAVDSDNATSSSLSVLHRSAAVSRSFPSGPGAAHSFAAAGYGWLRVDASGSASSTGSSIATERVSAAGDAIAGFSDTLTLVSTDPTLQGHLVSVTGTVRLTGSLGAAAANPGASSLGIGDGAASVDLDGALFAPDPVLQGIALELRSQASNVSSLTTPTSVSTATFLTVIAAPGEESLAPLEMNFLLVASGAGNGVITQLDGAATSSGSGHANYTFEWGGITEITDTVTGTSLFSLLSTPGGGGGGGGDPLPPVLQLLAASGTDYVGAIGAIVIPEPATWAALLGGAMLIVAAGARARRAARPLHRTPPLPRR